MRSVYTIYIFSPSSIELWGIDIIRFVLVYCWISTVHDFMLEKPRRQVPGNFSGTHLNDFCSLRSVESFLKGLVEKSGIFTARKFCLLWNSFVLLSKILCG